MTQGPDTPSSVPEPASAPAPAVYPDPSAAGAGASPVPAVTPPAAAIVGGAGDAQTGGVAGVGEAGIEVAAEAGKRGEGEDEDEAGAVAEATEATEAAGHAEVATDLVAEAEPGAAAEAEDADVAAEAEAAGIAAAAGEAEVAEELELAAEAEVAAELVAEEVETEPPGEAEDLDAVAEVEPEEEVAAEADEDAVAEADLGPAEEDVEPAAAEALPGDEEEGGEQAVAAIAELEPAIAEAGPPAGESPEAAESPARPIVLGETRPEEEPRSREPLDLGAWKPIEPAPGAQPRLEVLQGGGAAEAEAPTAEIEPDAEAEEVADEGVAAEGSEEVAVGEALLAAESEAAVGAAMLAAESEAASTRADETDGRAAGSGLERAPFESGPFESAAADPAGAEYGEPAATFAGVLPAMQATAQAAEWAAAGVYPDVALEPPRTTAEVYERSSDALERLMGRRPDTAWLGAEDIQYGAVRSLESTYAGSREGGLRVDPAVLELALGMAARGERVDDELIAEAATAAVGVLHEALRSLGGGSTGGGVADVFEAGATEAFVALHAEEWLAQLGFYDAFPGALNEPELSGERLAQTYTWQCVAARGYLERFASASGRLPASATDDFVKTGGGLAGLTGLHLDYLRAQRPEGGEPDLEAEAVAARSMTEEAGRLVAELAASGLRDPSSVAAVAAGIADQVMAGIAVPG